MSKNERDTHFKEFAKLLWEDVETAILDHYGFIPEGERLRRDFLPLMHTLIASRAYDLAVHIINNLSYHDFEPYTYEVAKAEVAEDDDDILSHIPDLNEWPQKDTSND